MAKKKPQPKQYSVPMRLEYRGSALVTATSAEEAKKKALTLDGVELPEGVEAELVNWDVTGEPQED